MTEIILASSSPYRRQLLDKLGLDYRWQAPDIDESPRPGESAADLVRRLAETKARVLASQYPKSLIIGSDQVATIDGEILGKPGNHERAVAQLLQASGRQVIFLTGLCLYNTESGQSHLSCETYSTYFRTLIKSEIETYLYSEKPYDCAGSFKAEGRGICLFTKLEGNDPNTLIGLPLIALIDMLKKEGVNVLET